VPVVDTPAAPAADAPLPTAAGNDATTLTHGSTRSSAGTRTTPPPDGSLAPTRALASLLIPPTSIGTVRLTPRAHASSPAAHAIPARERGRRGGSGGGDPRSPFGPDPTSPLVATGASSGSSGFVLILLLALAAAVTLLDPAGLGQRVAAAAARGRDRIARRIDRPG
jgi:hypothetical protein